MIPSQKFGVDSPPSPIRLAAWSHQVPRLTADSTPAGTPISRAKANAIAPSCSVTGSFCSTRAATGWRMRQE